MIRLARVYKGHVYVERAPEGWVMVTTEEHWKETDEPARRVMVQKALRERVDSTWPPDQTQHSKVNNPTQSQDCADEDDGS